MTIADFSNWQIKTDNLTEINVVNVKPGQKVEIVLDALPELTFKGQVAAIDMVYEEKRGDTTYTATIVMEQNDPQLRWGMTAAVEFYLNTKEMLMSKTLSIASYLAIKEVWRNRGRFLLVAMVIALITLLVLFIAALGEGLGNGNREYLSKLNADLVVFQAKSDYVIAASRLGRDRLAAVRRVDGVADAGMVGTSSASLILPDGQEPFKVAMLGVEPGRSGEPSVLEGQQLSTDLASEVIIDRNTAFRSNLTIGDTLTVRVTQGTRDEFFNLRIVGVADGQQFQLQPSIFVPFFTWDRIRSKSEAEVNRLTSVGNIIVVKLTDPELVEDVSQRLVAQVDNIEPATISKAI